MKILTIITSLFLIGCATTIKPIATDSRKPQSEEFEEYKLEVTRSFLIAGLPKPTITMHPGSYHLTVAFGKLSRPQFNLILENFKYPKLPVQFLPSYSSTRSYELIDFLPPKIQALANKRVFSNFSTPLPDWFQKYAADYLGEDRQDTILNDTNCWGTVHDVLLSDRYPDRSILFNYDKINDYYRNPKSFTRLNSTTLLKPYDFTLYYDQLSDGSKETTHASLYLGHGLIYEKEGLSEMDHYRIFYFRPGRENREFYRPIEGVQIKTAEEVFGLAKTSPRISQDLALELKDPAKRSFFESLILIPVGSGTSHNFFMSTALKLPLRKSTTTGRYKMAFPDSYPGNAFIGPIPKKSTEDY
jgi:hypothetical protein